MQLYNIIIIILLICNCNTSESAVTILKSDDTLLNGFSITEFASQYGYPAEVHKNIRTEDGYLLDIHRIPHGRRNKTSKPRPAVLVMHGMTASADCWVVNGPKSGLAFVLADRGYDVWLGNARGTSHCQKHVTLSPKSGKFWDFSWHEIGYYDVPALIKYILNVTQQEKLSYIGHSQGGSVYFVATTMRPELNKHIKLAIGLAPGAFYGFEGVSLPQSEASFIFGAIESGRKLLGINEVGSQLHEYLCHFPYMTDIVCNIAILYSAFGAGLDPTQADFSNFETVIKIFPDSSAARQFLHYMQLFLTAKFRAYDFGESGNRARYGSAIPPDYDLKKSTAPVALFSGPADILVTVYCTKRLYRELPNAISHTVVPYPLFTHLDFVLSKDAVKLLYNPVMALLDDYNHNK